MGAGWARLAGVRPAVRVLGARKRVNATGGKRLAVYCRGAGFRAVISRLTR
jgi:hypothetical protein